MIYREPVLITAPDGEPIAVDEAKLHTKIDYTEDDVLVVGWIRTARSYIEGRTNRALMTSTWDLWLDRFPCECEIRLPKGKLQSVAHVKYYDTAGTEYTVDPSTYHVATKREPGAVVLAYGQSWPSVTLRTAEAVVVRFACGFGDADAVPPEVHQSMYLLIEHFFANRGEVVLGTTASVETKRIQMGVESLLSCSEAYPLRMY